MTAWFFRMMDNDPFAAVVCVIGAFAVLFVISIVHDVIADRRRFRHYDGGCIHSPHTCDDCAHRYH